MAPVMKFEQLKELTHAFDGFVTVEGSDLPDYYKEVFPHHCECGGEVIMTADTTEQYGYTQLQCCNPDCWVKMAHRFAYFAKTLGYKGFGATGALALYRNLHSTFAYPTFLSIFEVPISEIRRINGDAYADSFEFMKQELATRGFQFKDAIASLGIPDLGKGSALFDIVKDPVVLLDYILKKRVDELCEAAGIYAPKTRYFLNIYRLDIVTLMKYVMPHILSTPKKEIHVAITGSVTVEGRGLTRAEFIWKCESLLDQNGTQAFKIIETKAESKLDYVIADAPSASSKYALGQRLNKLVTANDFYKMLKDAVEVSTDEQ